MADPELGPEDWVQCKWLGTDPRVTEKTRANMQWDHERSTALEPRFVSTSEKNGGFLVKSVALSAPHVFLQL